MYCMKKIKKERGLISNYGNIIFYHFVHKYKGILTESDRVIITTIIQERRKENYRKRKCDV